MNGYTLHSRVQFHVLRCCARAGFNNRGLKTEC